MAITPIQGAGSYIASNQQTAKPGAVNNRPDIEINLGNEPLSLLYRTAVAKLNELLAPDLGPDALQQAASSQIDFSPEAVAERIVSFATAFFPTYQERHADSGEEDPLDGFMSLVRDAIEQGFAEAREILDGLGVLEGVVKENADHTYDLIQEQLAAFEQGQRRSDE